MRSKTLRIEGAGEKSSSTASSGRIDRSRKANQPQYTLWFDGPRALHAFQECVNALSPCSFRIVQSGSHTRVSFDTSKTD